MKNQSLLAVALLLSLSACTKPRTAKLPEDLAKDVFTRHELESADIEIESQSLTQSLSAKQKLQAINEKPSARVARTKAPDRLKFMFKNLELAGVSAATDIRLKVTQDFVTAYKVLAKTEKLSALESALPTMRDHDGSILVPVFKYSVQDYGIIERIKNDLGEKTSSLTMTGTDWDKASHVRIATTTDARNLIAAPAAAQEELEEIFLIENLNNKVMTVKELKSVLNLNTFMLPITDENTKVFIKVGPDGLHIFEVAQMNSARLTEEERQFLRTGRSRGDLGGCPAEVQNAISAEEQKSCVVAARGKVDIEFVEANLDKTSSGKDYAADISFRPVKYQKNSRLVKIAEGSKIETLKPSAELNGAVEIAGLKGKEFFLRRTIEDAANTMFVPPGMSGEMAIVDITFEKGAAIVRRVESLLASGFNKPIDREELMRIPAKYYQLKKVDELGRPLVTPKLEDAELAQADLVKLDWENAAAAASNSPIYWLGFSGCLTGMNNLEIPAASVNDKLDSEQKISFSLDYTFGVSPECAATYMTQSGYALDQALQGTQKVRERISLHINDKKNDTGNQELPYYVQKALGFGGFTVANRAYDRFGNYGLSGTEKAYPIVFNIKNQPNNKVTFVLGGVSANNPYRQSIIDGAKEVVADINAALKESLSGSDLYAGKDVIELKIDGVDIESGHLGDLDRNYIWFEERVLESGPLGVAQPAPNPRSGFNEAANVIIYGGALKQQLGYFTERNKIMDRFDKLKGELISSAREQLGQLTEQSIAQAALLDKKAKLIADLEKVEAKQQPAISKVMTPSELIAASSKNQFATSLLEKMAKKHLNKATNLTASEKVVSKSQLSNIKQKTAAARTRAKLNSKTAFNGLSKNMIAEIFEKAQKSKSFNDPRAMEIIATESFLKHHSQELGKADADRVAKRLLTLKMSKQAKDAMLGQKPSCYLEANLQLNGQEFKTEKELFENSFKATLSHELGHALGLTHNFIASADKKNHGDKAYSSVMDYMDESAYRYTGMGNYDVHALRALYTGRIEAESGAMRDLTDFLNGELGQDWLKITRMPEQEIAAWDFKKFKYCNDYEVGLEPLCMQFDIGSSATEAVKNYIKDRETFYAMANDSRNRLSYTIETTGNYISAVMGDLTMIRSYLDGFLLALFTGANDEIVTDYLGATIEAYQYLNGVARTPETDLAASNPERLGLTVIPFPEPSATDEMGQPIDEDQLAAARADYAEKVKALGQRFMKIKTLDETGKLIELPVAIVIIDKKNTYDRYVSQRDIRIDTRGYEYDKAIASLLLGSRTSAGVQFERSGFPISFIELEAFLMGAKGAQSPTANFLKETLDEKVAPAAYDSVLGLVSLDASEHRVAVSTLQKDLVSDIAVFALAPSSTDGISEVNNYLFRVGNREGGAPKGATSVTRLEESRTSTTGIHYYQTDGANLTNDLIRDLANRRYMLEEKPEKLAKSIGQAADLYSALVAELIEKGMDPTVLQGDLAELAAAQPNLSGKLNQLVALLDRTAPSVGAVLKEAAFTAEIQNQARQVTEEATKVSAAFRMSLAENVYQIVATEESAKAILADPNRSDEEKQEAIGAVMKAREGLKNLSQITLSLAEQQSYLMIGFMGATEKITKESTLALMKQMTKMELNQIFQESGNEILFTAFLKSWGKEIPDISQDPTGFFEFLGKFNAFKEETLGKEIESAVIAANPKLKPTEKAQDQLSAEEKEIEGKKAELRQILAVEQGTLLADIVLADLGKRSMSQEQLTTLQTSLDQRAEVATARMLAETQNLPEYIDASETLKARWKDSFLTLQTLSQKYQLSNLESQK